MKNYLNESLLGKREHITPILERLHWLPVEQRVIFKILLITYKASNNLAPTYLSDCITKVSDAQSAPLNLW